MQGFRSARLGKLSPRAVRLLRQSNYALQARALHSSPSYLQAYADRLRSCADELRFRMLGFSEYLDWVAGLADRTRLERVWFAPAESVASMTARRSVEVIPPGTATMTSGRKKRTPPKALLIK